MVRAQFINQGTLTNTQDTEFRAVQDRWPVFALAHDLGSVTAASAPVVFAIGHTRDPAPQYLSADGSIQQRSLFFWTKYASMADAVGGSVRGCGSLSIATTVAYIHVG